jgi:hypothetical protein
LLIGIILLKQCRQFGYRKQPLNLRMRACYLDSHENGLRCYLVVHRKPVMSITAVLLHFLPIY